MCLCNDQLYFVHLKRCLGIVLNILYTSFILDPKIVVDWDDTERLRAFQISKKYRGSMIQYVQDWKELKSIQTKKKNPD